jgi:predicted amidohydrolase
MPDLTVAAIQMDARVGEVEINLAHAAELVQQAAKQGAQLVVLPEMFNTGYEYTDRVYTWPEPLDGPTAIWIAKTARRLNIHLVGCFPVRFSVRGVGGKAGKTYIAAMLAAPDGRHWIYRKVHVAMWENCYFDRGVEPVIADTDLGRIGLLICWDQIFADLARAYQGRVDLLCIPSSPPSWVGTMEDREGRVLTELGTFEMMGKVIDGVDWFDKAQMAHARTAGVPLVYASRCGTFHSPIPYGSSFLFALGMRGALRVLRSVGTRYWLRCPMMGRSRILNRDSVPLASTGQDGEAVLVAELKPGAPDVASLSPAPKGRSLVSDIPASQLFFDDSMIAWGRWWRRRHAPRS